MCIIYVDRIDVIVKCCLITTEKLIVILVFNEVFDQIIGLAYALICINYNNHNLKLSSCLKGRLVSKISFMN